MNVLFIMSDEHAREIAGCYGNWTVRTPNLDALAARGVVFENAYCNSPICVPSRASLATGDYVHRTGYWDSAAAYDGRIPSWHHRVREAGHDMVSIGKLHYRGPDDDNGFTEVKHPMYIADGIGDAHGLLRRDNRVRAVARELAGEAGRGMSVYTRYDTRVADATVDWLRERKKRNNGGPWALFSSMVSPHYPLTAPDEFYDLYAGAGLPRPGSYDRTQRPSHPVIVHYRKTWSYDDFFDEERLEVGLKAYYGLCSFLDFQVGRILAALEESGFADDTLVIYTSDHGENLGNRGLWGKCVHVRRVERGSAPDGGSGRRRGNPMRRPGLAGGRIPHGDRVPVRSNSSRASAHSPAGASSAWPARTRETASYSARCTTTAR